MKTIFLVLMIWLIATLSYGQDAETFTVCESGGGCDFTTMNVAEATMQTDLVNADSVYTFQIINEWTSTQPVLSFNGWNSDGTRFPTITAVGIARATAEWSTTAFTLAGATAQFGSQDQDITLDGIQTLQEHTGASFTSAIGNNSTGRMIVSNCFVKGNATATNLRGIIFNNAGLDNCVIRNNVVTLMGAEGIFGAGAADGGIAIDNNTVENCGIGIRTNADKCFARNNIVVNTTTPFVGDFWTTTLSEENYTDAGSISYGSCGSCGTGDQVSQSADPFIDLGAENYGLVADATAIDAGKDLSGEFTDAINGVTRPSGAGYDKGAYERLQDIIRKVMIRKN